MSTESGEVTRPAVATIGVFDGVHLGHQALLRQVVERSRVRDAIGVCVTFYPHPQDVLRPDSAIVHLSSLSDRVEMIKRTGIADVLVMHFSREMSQLSPEEFMDLLLARFQLKELWIGSDFALGKGRAGTPERLGEIGRSHGFDVNIFTPVVIDGGVASSSRIRQLLKEGQVAEASHLLGRWPRIRGLVVEGDRRGRTLGFPTANLELEERLATPADGIYVVRCSLDGTVLDGVASLGVRPTFGGEEHRVEVYLLDYSGDLYGRELAVDFVARLRDEERFDSVESLVAQMNADVQDAKLVLERTSRGS